MLQRLADAGLVRGKTVGIDVTTLEANAALRSIVRRDTGDSYRDFLTKLAQTSGIETATRADLARVDRQRKKKGSNDDWTHPHDPDAKITKMKDGRTHLAHKAEHAVALETGAIVAVTVQDADDGDTETSIETLIEAAEQIEAVRPVTASTTSLATRAITAISRSWISKGWVCAATSPNPIGDDGTGRRTQRPATRCIAIGVAFAAHAACGCWGFALSTSKAFAHLYEPGGMRRVHLRGHMNIQKRLLIHTAGFNLGLLMRQLIGVGTPRGLQGRLITAIATLLAVIQELWERLTPHRGLPRHISRLERLAIAESAIMHIGFRELVFTTGC